MNKRYKYLMVCMPKYVDYARPVKTDTRVFALTYEINVTDFTA